VVGEVGRGAYGVVLKVVEPVTGEVLVAKRIRVSHMSASRQARVLEEVLNLKRVAHRNIVALRTALVQGDSIYIIMEYCGAGDLQAAIDIRRREQRPYSEAELWRLLWGMLSGLAHLHKNRVVHRDIKAMNVLLTDDGTVKIGDLGIARVVDQDRAFLETQVGTPLYLAPEMVSQQRYDYKADVWALGCVMYNLAALKHPFHGDNIFSLGRAIVQDNPPPLPNSYSPKLSAIIMRMLEKRQEARPSCLAVLAMFPPAVARAFQECERDPDDDEQRDGNKVEGDGAPRARASTSRPSSSSSRAHPGRNGQWRLEGVAHHDGHRHEYEEDVHGYDGYDDVDDEGDVRGYAGGGGGQWVSARRLGAQPVAADTARRAHRPDAFVPLDFGARAAARAQADRDAREARAAAREEADAYKTFKAEQASRVAERERERERAMKRASIASATDRHAPRLTANALAAVTSRDGTPGSPSSSSRNRPWAPSAAAPIDDDDDDDYNVDGDGRRKVVDNDDQRVVYRGGRDRAAVDQAWGLAPSEANPRALRARPSSAPAVQPQQQVEETYRAPKPQPLRSHVYVPEAMGAAGVPAKGFTTVMRERTPVAATSRPSTASSLSGNKPTIHDLRAILSHQQKAATRTLFQ
jgi:serine/threonine protein kinase